MQTILHKQNQIAMENKDLSIPNIMPSLKATSEQLTLFQESINNTIIALEGATGLPLRKMLKEKDVKKRVLDDGTELPSQFSYIFKSTKDARRTFKLNIFTDGTIKIKLYWTDGSNHKTEKNNLSVLYLLEEYATSITEHLDPSE